MTMWENSPSSSGASTPLRSAAAASPRAHLFTYYAHLLQLAFVSDSPSMWVRPDEYVRLFGKDVRDEDEKTFLDDGESQEEDQLVEVSARDLARRALELIGDELALGS